MDPDTFKSKPLPTAGLYVHVPFCLSKCPYCHFYSQTAVALIPAWAEAVGKEAGLYTGRFKDFDTLYFGGGTPSLIPEAVLGQLLETVHLFFAIDRSGEITLEANPGDLTLERLKRLRTLGINRISLGVQSLDERELFFLKRRHTGREARQAIECIRSAGFENLSLDLIYGLPGQTPESWQKTLEEIVSLQPEHLSCYELTVEPGTALERGLRSGEIQLPPDEDRRGFFLQASTFLGTQGFDHYEVSNFARGAPYYARHNHKYWDHVPYLGLGPAAHSFDGRRRWWNGRSLRRYLERLAQNRGPVEREERLSAEQLRLESLMLGFRTRSGVALKDLSLNQVRRKVLTALEETGKIILQGDRMVPTTEGFLVADRLPLLFC